ncbi:MAG: acyl-CoA thioesterase [Geodermatophilaceae bacterium]
MPHRYDVAVRWSDEDRLGHVNNSRYLTYTEDARLSWLAESPSGNGTVILAHTEIDFVRPVHFVATGRLVVHTSVVTVGRSSMRLRQDIFSADVISAGDAVAEANAAGGRDRSEAVTRTEHVLVCYDYERQQSRPWMEPEAAWLRLWIAEKEST